MHASGVRPTTLPGDRCGRSVFAARWLIVVHTQRIAAFLLLFVVGFNYPAVGQEELSEFMELQCNLPIPEFPVTVRPDKSWQPPGGVIKLFLPISQECRFFLMMPGEILACLLCLGDRR
jgi:hypothetical protein